MAINQNHTVEELNGIKCAVVEKNVSKQRSIFLQQLLQLNKYQVEVSPTKSLPTKTLAEGENVTPTPETFTVGVTNLMFNSINAIFGRYLHTADGAIVTLAYWQEKESISNDEIPYFTKK